MRTSVQILVLLIAANVAVVGGIPFNENLLGTAAQHFSNLEPNEGWPDQGEHAECGRNVMAILESCCGGSFIPRRQGLIAQVACWE